MKNFYVSPRRSMNDCKYTSRVHESHSHTEPPHRLTYLLLPSRENLSANLIFQFSSLFTFFLSLKYYLLKRNFYFFRYSAGATWRSLCELPIESNGGARLIFCPRFNQYKFNIRYKLSFSIRSIDDDDVACNNGEGAHWIFHFSSLSFTFRRIILFCFFFRVT
jgi:hypothetical protein